MLLTSLLESSPVFSIHLKNEDSVYVAKVITHTTGELLLKNYQRYVRPDGAVESYKLIYNDKDIPLSDTLKELRIREGDLVKLELRECTNSSGFKRIKFDFTPDKPRSSMTIS
ncbi:3554_t:CDS:2 [Acaulospora morrowiae]|uniref:3554_t:CDS:1 n=1 Tax=Acaulospora morrowiae TaxID=94023 RepID=A0A9N9B1T0_9GLOM|nr:3554_t:CDS:2 [Acaulospora morrowiae]